MKNSKKIVVGCLRWFIDTPFGVVLLSEMVLLGFIVLLLSGCGMRDAEELSVESELQRIQLQEVRQRLTDEMSVLETLVLASAGGDYITGVEPLADGSGVRVSFRQYGAVVIRNGAEGEIGDNGFRLGVEKGTDGRYYWLLQYGTFTLPVLDENGNPFPVTGILTPLVGVDASGYWTVNGERIKDTAGKEVKATGEKGEQSHIFSGVYAAADYVEVRLKTGEIFKLERYSELRLITGRTSVDCSPGKSFTVECEIKGSGTAVETSVLAPDGWQVEESRESPLKVKLTVTAPKKEDVSRLLVFASDSRGKTVVCGVDVSAVYKMGDIYYSTSGLEIGVVFREKNGLTNGLAIGLRESSLAWSKQNVQIGCLDASDGRNNMISLNAYISGGGLLMDFPAFEWCLQQTGAVWYLPASDELYELKEAMRTGTTIGETLALLGGTAITGADYWSSTEEGNTWARCCNFSDENYYTLATKLGVKKCRCITDF